jgi:nuclear GTP-binding protein
VLKGCVRVERIDDPAYYIDEVLRRVKKESMAKFYGVVDWTDSEDFLKQLAEKRGRLLKVIKNNSPLFGCCLG